MFLLLFRSRERHENDFIYPICISSSRKKLEKLIITIKKELEEEREAKSEFLDFFNDKMFEKYNNTYSRSEEDIKIYKEALLEIRKHFRTLLKYKINFLYDKDNDLFEINQINRV